MKAQLPEVINRILNPTSTSGRECPECGRWRGSRYFQSTEVPKLPTTKQRRSWLNWMTDGTGKFPPESEIPCCICGVKDVTLVGEWEHNRNHPASKQATLMHRWYNANINFQPGDPVETEKYRAWIRSTFGPGSSAKPSDFNWEAKPWLD